jgi:hypothetical protein
MRITRKPVVKAVPQVIQGAPSTDGAGDFGIASSPPAMWSAIPFESKLGQPTQLRRATHQLANLLFFRLRVGGKLRISNAQLSPTLQSDREQPAAIHPTCE